MKYIVDTAECDHMYASDRISGAIMKADYLPECEPKSACAFDSDLRVLKGCVGCLKDGTRLDLPSAHKVDPVSRLACDFNVNEGPHDDSCYEICWKETE